MTRFKIWVVFCIAFIMGLGACAAWQKALEDPTEPQAYLLARRALNTYWQQYLDFRDAMPDGPEKSAFRAKFRETGKDSYFTKANIALGHWKDSIGTDDSYGKQKLFDVLIEQIVSILLAEGVIKIE
jgi:hypothetical protein